MKVKDLFQGSRPVISFEFFPPKTKEAEQELFKAIQDLKSLSPSFVSVTYGAMGNTRENTTRIVTKIKNEIGIETVAHLTCVAHSKHEIETILEDLLSKNVQNVMALRGDPPKGEIEFKPVENGFRYASELVRYIRHHPKFAEPFSLAVAGYPEGHPQCVNMDEDLHHLRYKVEQGADLVVTQLFFENDFYYRFIDRCRGMGIQIPIVPGIMPVTQGSQIERFASMCGASIPSKMKSAIDRYGDDQRSVEAFGIEYASEQCQNLLKNQVPGLHFYTLNKSNATQKIYRNLFQNNDTQSKNQ